MSSDPKQWTEYIVRCRRLAPRQSRKKWETVNLSTAGKEQALSFYENIKRGDGGVLERPQIIERTVIERRVKPSDLTRAE